LLFKKVPVIIIPKGINTSYDYSSCIHPWINKRDWRADMNYDIKDIKNIRKQVGITQEKLAELSGVSQSLIAKVESEHIDASYSNIQKIFATLDGLKSKKEPMAKDLMQKRIVTTSPKDNVKNAIERMRRNSISQLPVVDDGKIIGLVTESGLLEMISNGKHASKISDIMKDSPPIVTGSTNAKIVINLLKFYSIVLVIDKGKLQGIITKSDIIEKMY
jgi:predicted transcriptional regulator